MEFFKGAIGEKGMKSIGYGLFVVMYIYIRVASLPLYL